jgi:hypothetical protein
MAPPASPGSGSIWKGQLRREDEFERRIKMARKSKLTQVAVKIGSAMGRADRTAHKVAKAGLVAKGELEAIAKQVEGLKRQLLKTTKRLKRALV